MRISDWSSDVCSSDLRLALEVLILVLVRGALLAFFRFLALLVLSGLFAAQGLDHRAHAQQQDQKNRQYRRAVAHEHGEPAGFIERQRSFRHRLEAAGHDLDLVAAPGIRSEEHTSELQSLMRISYAVF